MVRILSDVAKNIKNHFYFILFRRCKRIPLTTKTILPSIQKFYLKLNDMLILMAEE